MVNGTRKGSTWSDRYLIGDDIIPFCDMVMPIAPNTQYAKGRKPISTEPSFPFDNCFFWIFSDLSLRVRRQDTGYNESSGVKLSAKMHVTLSRSWNVECERLDAAVKRHQKEVLESTTAEAVDAAPRVRHPGNLYYRPITMFPSSRSLYEVNVDAPETDDDIVMDESSSDSGSVTSNDSDSDAGTVSSEVKNILALNLLGWDPDPRFEFIPLVDLWLELDEHLNSDTIPDPTGLYQERDKIES